MAAKKQGWILTVTICPSYGMRPQVDISKTAIKKNGGLDSIKEMAETQAQERNQPIAFLNAAGDFVFKSSNWPEK
jgi:hypothetical protein